LCRLQRSADFAGGLVTPRGLLLHAAVDHALQLGRQHTPRSRLQRFRRHAQDGGAQLESGLALKRSHPGRHLVQHDAQRPDIAPGIGRLSLELLRRHVGQGADDLAGQLQRVHGVRGGLGKLRVADPGRQPEIEHLGAALRGDHNVAALEVAVDDPVVVRVGQGVRHLVPQAKHLVGSHPVAREPLAQRFTGDKLHRDVGLTLGLPHLVDRAHVRVVELRGQARLAQQT